MLVRTKALSLTLATALLVAPIGLACSQPAQIGQVDIQPVAVPGPPEGWDMSTRLMNRQSASVATLSGGGGAAGPGTARFESVSGSMYYDAGRDEPFTGTLVMRADSLTSQDAGLQQQLHEWLEPTEYPAFIFQSTGSARSADGFVVEGNLFVRDEVVAVTSHWKAVRPVTLGDDLRKNADLAATLTAAVPGAPFPGGELRLELMLPVVGYTADFVENLLASKGIDVAALTGGSPSYPSDPSDLSDVAWYLMLAGHTDQALDVFRLSLEKSAALNTYLRMSDGYVFDGQYDMAVGSYTALEPYNPGQPHGLELVKVLGGMVLDVAKVAEINRALTGG